MAPIVKNSSIIVFEESTVRDTVRSSTAHIGTKGKLGIVKLPSQNTNIDKFKDPAYTGDDHFLKFDYDKLFTIKDIEEVK
jgi:hypothetical protein